MKRLQLRLEPDAMNKESGWSHWPWPGCVCSSGLRWRASVGSSCPVIRRTRSWRAFGGRPPREARPSRGPGHPAGGEPETRPAGDGTAGRSSAQQRCPCSPLALGGAARIDPGPCDQSGLECSALGTIARESSDPGIAQRDLTGTSSGGQQAPSMRIYPMRPKDKFHNFLRHYTTRSEGSRVTVAALGKHS